MIKTVLVCGSREYDDQDAIDDVMKSVSGLVRWPKGTRVRVIHGDARGADRMAAAAATKFGYEVVAFPADWRMGKGAGKTRNLQMLDEKPDVVIAFGWGKGTNHTCANATDRGIQVVRIG